MISLIQVSDFWPTWASSYLHDAAILHNKFQVLNRYSRWPPCSHLGFPIATILAIFDLHVILILPDISSHLFSLSVQEKKDKIYFKDCGHGGHLGFPIGMIFNIFIVQNTLILLSKFQVYWPFGSGEKAQNRF